MGPGFPHGISPWAEGPRDSGNSSVSSRGVGRRPVWNSQWARFDYSYYLEHAMRRVTAREANQRFSEVLSAVETGEQVVITKRGGR